MAFRIVLLSLLIGSVSAEAPCGTVAPAAKPAPAGPAPKTGLTVPEEVGIGLGVAAGVAALGGGIAAAVKPKEAAAKRGPRINAKEASNVTAAPTAAPVITTAAPTPWDSSSGSFGDSSASSMVSASLDSLLSDDSSGSMGSSGSTHSGTSGFYLPIIVWVLLIALCCVCIGAGAGGAKKKKATKKKKKSAPSPAPAAAEQAAVEVEPLLPALMPLATSSALVPSYSMVAAPATYAPMTYAAPATTSYVQAAPQMVEYVQAAPQMMEYVQAAPQVEYIQAPQMTYAAPQMTYAAPQQFVETVAAPQYATQAYATQAYAAPMIGSQQQFMFQQ